MSKEAMSAELESVRLPSGSVAAGPVQSLVRFLYTHNPFYLVGTMLILFGLQQALGNKPGLATGGLLAASLAGYTLLLAAIATIVIRYGKVWDDARTILLVIVLMFFMLSTSLDAVSLTLPLAGSLILAAGLAFSIALSEGLLRGLRIQLAPQYRVPYYLMLSLLFVWPIAMVWINFFSLTTARPWALLAFPALAALALLTLLPAARTSRRREPATGTPWPWPYFPWSLFVYLTIGVAIRSWWLTISFEPSHGPDAYFRPYFLFPLCLTWGALTLEIGKARHSPHTIAAGLALPLAGLLFVFPGHGQGLVETTFLNRLIATLGSPAQLAVWGLIAFYLWAWRRNIRAAEGFAALAGLSAAFVGSQTLDLGSFTRPQPIVLGIVALVLLVLAIQRQSTWRAVAVGAMAATAFAYLGRDFGPAAWFWQWHAPVIGLVAISAIFDDALARFLRELAWRAAPVLAAVAAITYSWLLPAAGPIALAVYLALLLIASVALWRRQKSLAALEAALATLAANGLAIAQQGYVTLDRGGAGDSLPWLTAGLAAVGVAFLISLLKMGLWPWLQSSLGRLNAQLGGMTDA
jgi:hypothetical protein